MRYVQLRAFHHVALHGGFSRAARALNQTQPSVSDQVRRLEEAHDVLLFRRAGRTVALTQAGEELFKLTKSFFEVEQGIEAYLDQNRENMRGRLRIVADSAVHVTNAIGRFRVAHPNVAVALWSGNTEEVLARLRAYDAEVGVVGNTGDAADLDCIEIGRSPVVAVAGRGLIPGEPGEIGFEDLAKWPLVMREEGSRTRAQLLAAAAEAGIELSSFIEVEGREAMREVVASGAGLGFVSDAEFGNDPRLRKIAIRGPELTMTETLVTLRARRDVPVVRAFLKALT